MPQTDVIPTSASVTSTGPGIRYIGTGNRQYAYAYSGTTQVDNNYGSLLSFVSGSGVIVATLQVAYFDEDQGDDIRFEVLFNSLKISCLEVAGATTTAAHQNDWMYLDIIVPPFTEVLVRAKNRTDTDNRNVGATFTGRVYGAE